MSSALTRGLCPEKLQLNVSIYFLFDIKTIFNHLLANKIKTIKYASYSKPPIKTTNNACDCFLAGSRFVEQSDV